MPQVQANHSLGSSDRHSVSRLPGGRSPERVSIDAHVRARFRDGDPDAVRAVYSTYRRLVYAAAHSILGERGLAEEATQQTFVKAWRAAQSFDEQRALELAALFAEHQTWHCPTLIRLHTQQFPDEPEHTYSWVEVGKSELYSLGLNSASLKKDSRMNADVENALEELLFAGGALNRKLLGAMMQEPLGFGQ